MPPYDEIKLENISNKRQKVFFPPDLKLKDIKTKIARYVTLKNPDKAPVFESHLRIWKCNSSQNNPEKFKEYLKEKNIGTDDDIKIANGDSRDEIEENSGVDFPGQSIEPYTTKTYKEIENTSNLFNGYFDLVVVEQSSTTDNKFIFRYNKNPAIKGKCEGCY